ncbi:transcriptional regulator [Streptomyces albiflavescens]|uniref:Transcriptional regulator n=1 Tax=Streptomyces albiflavescens TaxID=1623582 RepID=A0A917YDD1_9ACTN|nr:transcriptional regulator [Streptomyces albiflavescens]
MVTGEPGSGKSTLVDWAAAEASAQKVRTLRVRGSEGESGLCLAGAHQLLRPLLGAMDGLPERQRLALHGAFGLGTAPETASTDPLLLHLGALTLLSDAAAEQPLLLLVDDAQWLDLGTLDLLAFVARRLDGERICLLLAAREEAVPARFDRDFPHLAVGPLERAAAVQLLDAQPTPPQGRARAQILQQAAGNPLALIELSLALAHGRTGPAGAATLPLTRRLKNLFAAELPALPADTRRALLLAAAAGTARLVDVLRAAPDLAGLEALLPAEGVGLVRVADGQVTFRHPLVRSAVYQAASFSERRATHLALADALTDQPDRRAWHLAAAALGPDRQVADALADSAEHSRSRGGHAAAATALERAAELTPDLQQRAERLLAAARSAMYAGHPQWVADLTARVADVTQEPRLRAEASLWRGWALGVTLAHDEALAVLLPVAEAMADPAPALALGALSTAATSAYNSGDPFYQGEFARICARVVEDDHPVDAAWSHAALHPHTQRADLLLRLERAHAAMTPDSVGEIAAVGATAWILDETELAVRLLGQAMDHLRRTGTTGTNATVAQALALARFESGAWAGTQAAAEDAFWMATEAGADNVTVGSSLLQATLHALRGDHEAARVLAQQAVRGLDLRKSRSLHVRYRHALGLAATVAGDHGSAYDLLRATYTRDFQPLPVHYHASVYYLGDLAAAAVRADRIQDARSVLEAAQYSLGPTRSSRVHAVVERAAALLSAPEDAEQHFLGALDDPACTQWPFELALTRLDFGEWLRRQRRAAEARPMLSGALEVFQRLGAQPWAERATAELRAAGAPVTVPTAPAAELTPQERQIAELAAQGLTNRDIAARLYLSPRTVGYHLHKIFPKLGIRSRGQLRDALSPDAAPSP